MWSRLSEHYRKWWFGLRTSQTFVPEDLGHWQESYQIQVPTDYRSLHHVIRHIDVGGRGAFLD